MFWYAAGSKARATFEGQHVSSRGQDPYNVTFKFKCQTMILQKSLVQFISDVCIMALPVMEFQVQGYKIRKIFA